MRKIKHRKPKDLKDTRNELRKAKIKVGVQNTRFNNAYKHLVEMGLNQSQISKIFGLGRSIKQRMAANPDFAEAHQEAMDALECKMASNGIKQALGYDYEEVETISKYEPPTEEGKYGTWKPYRRKCTTKHQPGNASAFQYMMSNMYPENWKKTSEIVTKNQDYDSDPSERHRKQIASLARDILEADTDRPDTECEFQDRPAQLPVGCVEGSEE